MAKLDVLSDYILWIERRVLKPDMISKYHKLMATLYSIPFTWTIKNDENRAADGIDLRSSFGEEKGVERDVWHQYLDGRCTVLEMMAALAIRCEDCVMGESEYGDRTWFWFMKMVHSLSLEDYTDDNFDVSYVREIVKRALKRDYSYDGYGGFWYVKGCQKDLRDVEIWYQMHEYLSTLDE